MRAVKTLLPKVELKMIDSKKAQWMWLVYGAIAILIFVVSWIIIRSALGGADTSIKNFQSCEGQNGRCKQNCADNEMAYFKQLGCGSKETDTNKYCCIPQKT